ncbi:unnamed protein product [Musa hybrid cultivar]
MIKNNCNRYLHIGTRPPNSDAYSHPFVSLSPIARQLRRCPLDRSLRRNHSRRSSCCVKPGDFKVHEHMKISCP